MNPNCSVSPDVFQTRGFSQYIPEWVSSVSATLVFNQPTSFYILRELTVQDSCLRFIISKYALLFCPGVDSSFVWWKFIASWACAFFSLKNPTNTFNISTASEDVIR